MTKTENKHMPAFAANKSLADESRHVEGLTKREFAAIAAMQGALTNGMHFTAASTIGVRAADALLDELEKTE